MPTKATPKRTGRPPFEATPEQRALVKSLSSFGVPHESIRGFIKSNGKPIAGETLRKHFAEELTNGTIEANAKVAGRLFTEAMNGNTTAMIFWLKVRARWAEAPQQVAFTDPDGKPAHVPTLADFYKTVETVRGGAAPAAGADGDA